MANDKIVAVALPTDYDRCLLGPAFRRIWLVEDTPCFSDLIEAIDEADREIRGGRDPDGEELPPI